MDNDLSSNRAIQRQAAVDYLRREIEFARRVGADKLHVDAPGFPPQRKRPSGYFFDLPPFSPAEGGQSARHEPHRQSGIVGQNAAYPHEYGLMGGP